MKLVTFDRDRSPALGIVLSDGSVFDAASIQESKVIAAKRIDPVADDMVEALTNGGLDELRRLRDAVEALAVDDKESLRISGVIHGSDNIEYYAPIPRPGFILAQGFAYKKHLGEMGVPLPKTPVALVKAPSSVTGTRHPIVLPSTHPDMVDWEGELSVVIGKNCHNVSEREAMEYVAGYTIINDVSARDWTARALDPNQTPMQAMISWGDNIHGKQFPSFTPMGPAFVTSNEIPDPHNLELSTLVNGEVMQKTNTSDLIFSISHTISHFSKWYLFQPGDIITTGSPSGVGYGRDPKIFLKSGDIVEITVTGLGTLSNPVANGSDTDSAVAE